ncbi:hypothetical protein [Solwaraspora sp. WMMD792]|uniref:hypothetical protein n=1 Tax=Solwaraspora sp. WMMD792 TaxID=3016099 RepID=UPI0024162127|nr:hypothetical protein [Solwaraspora sp. WMMD792]MDG4771537.1 hypothetical protein [Solwaraspora sp. WMMD792]
MHVFPAEIPAAEARRADVVEVRVARKVASLFGVDGDLPPFHRSWVCDYTTLSLAEIGRGAPAPDKAQRSGLDAATFAVPATDGDRDWSWVGRAVWAGPQAPLPGGLSNATLNRYGPDTKAAAVLAAANRLLRDATAAVAAAAQWLASGDCDREIRLAVWAGLVLEVYRAQPALVVAAVQARQVQRSLSARWGRQVDRARVVAGDDAPSEIRPWAPQPPDDTGAERADARWRPTSFDLVDATLPAIGLAVDKSGDPAGGVGVVSPEALDDIASAWCHRLLDVGRPGRGVVWLTEDDRGSRHVQAMVRVGAVVAPFVAASLGGVTRVGHAPTPTLPTLPDAGELAGLPLLHRRAHLLVAHVATNYLRYRDELLTTRPDLRHQTRELVALAVVRSGEVLDPTDPVALLLRAYGAYLDVWDSTRELPGPDADPDPHRVSSVRRLIASQQHVVESWRSGRMDPGAAAYLLEIGITALLDATSLPAALPDPDSPVDPTEASVAQVPASMMKSWWSATLTARGIDPDTDLATVIDSLSDAQVFHLHHYADWRSRTGRRGDLRQALAVQERVAAVRTEVVRRETAGYAAKAVAARSSHQLAARIATDLALATPDREHAARARACATAVRHARTVLSDLTVRRDSPQASASTAQVVARALCVAAANGITVDPRDAAAAVALLDRVTASATASADRTPSNQWVGGLPLTQWHDWHTTLSAVADHTIGG